MSQISEEQQKIYEAALPLVDCIGENLDRVDGGRVHYRTKAGKILLNLDQVVRAILADDLRGGSGSPTGAGRVDEVNDG